MMGSLMNKDTDVSTAIRNNVENMNLAEVTPSCISNIELVNSMVIKPGAKAIDNKQTILANFYQKCVGSVSSSMNSVAENVNTSNQKAKITEENPLQFLADMVGSVTGSYSIIIICVIGGFLYLVSGGFLGSGEGSPLSDLTKGFGSALSGATKTLVPTTSITNIGSIGSIVKKN
jgi:hypothetical protein